MRNGTLKRTRVARVCESRLCICVIRTDNIPVPAINQVFNVVTQHLSFLRERVTHASSRKIPPLRIDVLNLYDVVD